MRMKSENSQTRRARPILAVTVNRQITAWLRKGAKKSNVTLSRFTEAALKVAYQHMVGSKETA
jgi:hypothetical protein